MTFENLRLLNGQTAFAGLDLDHSWTVTTQEYFGL